MTSLIHLIPGDPIDLMLGETASTVDREALRRQLGLDRPLWQQYLTFFQRAAPGELSYSLHNRRPVSILIGERLPATAALARAKGLVGWIVVGKHALGNALMPLVTLIGLQGGALLLGAVITETIFAWPGLGDLTIRAIQQRDYPVVQGCVVAREMEYVTAARATGAASGYILLWHILPNIAGPLIVQATFSLAGVIVAEAGLSFLGLGVQPPTPSWGAMLNEGRMCLVLAPHLTIFPGGAIMLAVLGCNLLGDGLRDLLDPRGHTN